MTSAPHRWLGAGLLILGAGLAANSVLGPLVAGVVEYPLSRSLLNQTLGLEAVSLVLVAPVSVAAGVLVLRGHRAGPVLALAPALYAAYMLVQYVVGPDYLRFPGVLPFHLCLFVLAELVAAGAWAASGTGALPGTSRGRERALGVVLLVVAAFVTMRYLPGLAGSASGDPIPSDAREQPAMYWSILLMDMGVVVPATVAAGVSLLRGGAAWSRKAAHAVVGWFALVGTAVAAMGVAMLLDGDPNASGAAVAVFGMAAMAFVGLALWAYGPLFGLRA